MKVYIAGSSAELPRVKQAYGMLQELGLEVTHKWWEVIEGRGHANPKNASVLEKSAWVRDDMAGVRESDILWLLWPVTSSIGCYVELGQADTLGKRIVISGGDSNTSIFSTLGCIEPKDSDGLKRIKRIVATEEDDERFQEV